MLRSIILYTNVNMTYRSELNLELVQMEVFRGFEWVQAGEQEQYSELTLNEGCSTSVIL